MNLFFGNVPNMMGMFPKILYFYFFCHLKYSFAALYSSMVNRFLQRDEEWKERSQPMIL